jgi:peptide-methionine (S)-S-oxide reductase
MKRVLSAGLFLWLFLLALTGVAQAKTLAHATLGGGCFWAMQAEFEQLRGVESAKPGFAGGHSPNPSYEAVGTGSTGHAEVVDIAYDPKSLSYESLLSVFLGAHDPTTLNRQGPDSGSNYRSIILTRTPSEAAIAHRVIAELTRKKAFASPIVTEVKPLDHFYPAEAYHEHYCATHTDNGYCRYVVSGELARFRAKFGAALKR